MDLYETFNWDCKVRKSLCFVLPRSGQCNVWSERNWM